MIFRLVLNKLLLKARWICMYILLMYCPSLIFTLVLNKLLLKNNCLCVQFVPVIWFTQILYSGNLCYKVNGLLISFLNVCRNFKYFLPLWKAIHAWLGINRNILPNCFLIIPICCIETQWKDPETGSKCLLKIFFTFCTCIHLSNFKIIEQAT